MNTLRTVNAISVMLCGIAIGLVAADMPRAAIVVIAIVVILFAWGVEMLRHTLSIATRLNRPENRS